jgi:predicted nucleic acid-binding protein
MLYVDTSVLVTLVVREAMSPIVDRWFRAAGTGTLMTSGWTSTEFASAIGNRVRRNEMSEGLGREALSTFEAHILPAMRIVSVDPADFRVAVTFVAQFELGLRAGDALHLATARRAGATGLVSLDRRFSEAAKALGMPAVDLEGA